MVGHIVWDWNGTLLDDGDVVYRASCELFQARGLPPVTLSQYRAAYTRPISEFYRRLWGMSFSDTELEAMNDGFHEAYQRALRDAPLATGAAEVLSGWRALGGTQSLLSMFRHDRLLPLVSSHGIASEFVRIDGLLGAGGGQKQVHLEKHLAALGLTGPEVLLVGDSLDDAAAATAVGAACVLYNGGAHERSALEATGLPVVDHLADCSVGPVPRDIFL
ncbi:HAD family hydrolase [Pseudonocardia spinosispora]|uniref:HAD family hydrolase n=1 Tax=Pseudonocardia spinosispora TaxID=103441 RepID=UPI0003F8855D|nr:HAD hydrolase-like protein [Pseudonocardia spinosispora]